MLDIVEIEQKVNLVLEIIDNDNIDDRDVVEEFANQLDFILSYPSTINNYNMGKIITIDQVYNKVKEYLLKVQ